MSALHVIDIRVDVSDVVGAPAEVATTVYSPPNVALSEPSIVCFGFPGGGYNRSYWALDIDAGEPNGQAGFHTDHGWIFVTVDHLNVGESTLFDPDTLTYETVCAANAAAAQEITARLAAGTVADDLAPVENPVRLAMGQSMGGCFTVVLQGQHHLFDGVGILGYSAIHTHVPSAPGRPDVAMPWMPRGSTLAAPVVTNAAVLGRAEIAATDPDSLAAAGEGLDHPWTWAFHHDAEPRDIVEQDMIAISGGPLPSWRSETTPMCAIFMVTPGAVAAEAAAIDVPVFVGNGERDVVSDPRREPQAYLSSPDITVATFPQMAHMHNFAPTRRSLWRRLHNWGEGVAAERKPS